MNYTIAFNLARELLISRYGVDPSTQEVPLLSMVVDFVLEVRRCKIPFGLIISACPYFENLVAQIAIDQFVGLNVDGEERHDETGPAFPDPDDLEELPEFGWAQFDYNNLEDGEWLPNVAHLPEPGYTKFPIAANSLSLPCETTVFPREVNVNEEREPSTLFSQSLMKVPKGALKPCENIVTDVTHPRPTRPEGGCNPSKTRYHNLVWINETLEDVKPFDMKLRHKDNSATVVNLDKYRDELAPDDMNWDPLSDTEATLIKSFFKVVRSTIDHSPGISVAHHLFPGAHNHRLAENDAWHCHRANCARCASRPTWYADLSIALSDPEFDGHFQTRAVWRAFASVPPLGSILLGLSTSDAVTWSTAQLVAVLFIESAIVECGNWVLVMGKGFIPPRRLNYKGFRAMVSYALSDDDGLFFALRRSIIEAARCPCDLNASTWVFDSEYFLDKYLFMSAPFKSFQRTCKGDVYRVSWGPRLSCCFDPLYTGPFQCSRQLCVTHGRKRFVWPAVVHGKGQLDVFSPNWNFGEDGDRPWTFVVYTKRDLGYREVVLTCPTDHNAASVRYFRGFGEYALIDEGPSEKPSRLHPTYLGQHYWLDGQHWTLDGDFIPMVVPHHTD